MNDYVVEEETVGKYTVKVLYDPDPCDNLFDCDWCPTWGIDMSNHRDYASPTYGDAMPVDMHTAMDPEPEDKWSRMQFFKNYYVMPVYMYDHSSRTVNTSGFSCPWDSGMTGFVYVGKKEFRKWWGLPKRGKTAEAAEKAQQYLKSTVKELDYHMTGQVYGYIVEDADGEEVDSCWGFVGEAEYCLQEGKSMAEWHVKDDRKKRLARVKELIVNHVPLQLREQELRPQH